MLFLTHTLECRQVLAGRYKSKPQQTLGSSIRREVVLPLVEWWCVRVCVRWIPPVLLLSHSLLTVEQTSCCASKRL